MIQVLFFAAAAAALSACTTMPDFMQAQTGASASTSSTASASGPANISAASGAAPASTAAPAPAAAAPRYNQPPDQQLLEIERRLSAQAQQSGLGAALGSVIDPTDGFVVRAGQTYQGADAVARGLTAPSGAGPIYWQPDRVFVSQAGDMGLTSGRYVQVMTGTEAVQGRYTAVWRRDGGGQWKLLSESRIADPPRSAARPAARAPARRR